MAMDLDAVTIRKAGAADLPAIVALLAEDELGRHREDAGLPLDRAYEEAFAAIDADPNQLLAVAELDGEIIGTFQLSFIPSITRMGTLRAQIEGVRVASARQNAGLGRMMMVWAIEQCRQRGGGLVQLTTDKSRADAHRFYDRLGFRATHEGYKLFLAE